MNIPKTRPELFRMYLWLILYDYLPALFQVTVEIPFWLDIIAWIFGTTDIYGNNYDNFYYNDFLSKVGSDWGL